MKKLFIINLICLSFYFLNAQEVKISGLIKQPVKEFIRATIVVNDTINKLAKLIW